MTIVIILLIAIPCPTEMKQFHLWSPSALPLPFLNEGRHQYLLFSKFPGHFKILPVDTRIHMLNQKIGTSGLHILTAKNIKLAT